MSHPKFVVVGHPNKGKSSIVSTLTLDDSVTIGNRPGTTTKSRSFKLKDGAQTLYELIDTPGFQRPKKLLQWLRAQGDLSAQNRPKLLQRFVAKECAGELFKDECEIVRPILRGAGIIYVVDASKPYSSEYEAEMEILRFGARPSMAILNYIGEGDYTKEWRAVLGQYFSIVKPFNPLKATFEEHIDLLDAMRHIAPEWSGDIAKTVALLEKFHQEQKGAIAKIIASRLCQILGFKMQESYHIMQPIKEVLLEKFKRKIEFQEQQLFKEIKELLHFNNSAFELPAATLEYPIFSKESQEIFGLGKEKILLLSTLSSATAGGAVDLAVGGHSFLLGTILGGALGYLGANYGYGKLSSIKFLSNKRVTVGPIEDVNIGFILLNRALAYANTLLHTTHANRQMALINDETKLKELKHFAKINKKCQKSTTSLQDKKAYEEMILELL